MYVCMTSLYVAQPVIYIHPMDRTIEINNDSTSIVLTCMAYGAFSYYWLKENHTIQPSSMENTTTSSLILINIMPSDSGHYQCVAENNHGRVSSDYAKLTVKGMTYITYHSYIV